MRDILNKRFAYNAAIIPLNVIGSLEQNFKQILDIYVEQRESLYNVRTETYKEIIEMINETYDLSFNDNFQSAVGNYTEAYWMYDFFVCNYIPKLIEFYAIMIDKNIDSLYKSIIAVDDRSDATLFGKKIYAENPQLGIIMNNIDAAIANISVFDFDLQSILTTVYPIEAYSTILNAVHDNNDFFRNHYAAQFNTDLRPVLTTEIRFALHTNYVSSHNVSQNPIM
jgi:hypothetical protein